MVYVEEGRIADNVLIEPGLYQRHRNDSSASRAMFGHQYFPEKRHSQIWAWSSKNAHVAGPSEGAHAENIATATTQMTQGG